MQPKMFYTSVYIHMCLNSDCFYCETILSLSDIVFKETWNSEIEDLDMIPHCPSCGEVLWREVNDNAV